MKRKTKGTHIVERVISFFKRPSLRPELRFPQLPNASPEPILITDAKARICYVNPAWEKLTGYTFVQVQGKNPRILNSGKTPKRVFRDLWKTLAKGTFFITEEIVNRKKNGQEYQVSSTFFPIRKRNRNVFYVQVQHDITGRVLREKLKSEFFSMASHELKTPITTLKLLGHVILNRYKKEKIKSDEVKIFNKELNRLANLINEMLDVSRIESGKLSIRVQKMNLTNLTKSVVEKMRFVAEKRRIVFDPKKNIQIQADVCRLEQVLTNLLTNAIKYSQNKTTITVRLEKHKKKVILSVEDQGKGIPKDKLKRIFEPYYQIGERNKDGLGLGLAICQEIVKRHKGKIWVTSQVGKGTTFFFSLPLPH